MIETLIEIAKDAGQEILKIYERDFEIYEKDDKSPLTEADLAANEIIVKGLKENFPDIPILSEESAHTPYEERKHWKKFFLVDPIDGTKEFIKKNGEFTVNIALIEGQSPVAGVVLIPTQERIYFAEKGKGAYLRECGEDKKLPLFPMVDGKLRVVASKSHLNQETKDFVEFLKGDREVEFVQVGSSIKLCKVAEGSADIYPRVAPTSEWDTAASQIIVEEAGGRALQLRSGDSIIYNKEILQNPNFVIKRRELNEN